MSLNPLFLGFQHMVVVAQLVRASVCGTEGRGFEPHHPPQLKLFSELRKQFFYALCSSRMAHSLGSIFLKIASG